MVVNKKKRVLLLGGTPGTGKTTIARRIHELTGIRVIHLTDFIKENKLWEEYDEERDSYVIDEERFIEVITRVLENVLDDEGEESIILEGHFVELIPEPFVSQCVILRVDPGVLRERLLERGYNEAKIQENMEAEIMEVCLTEALYSFSPEKTSVVVTSGRSVEDSVSEVLRAFGLRDVGGEEA